MLAFAAELAGDRHDDRALAMSLMRLGVAYTRQGQYDDGLRAAERAREVSAARGYTDLEARLWLNIGIVHRRRGDLDLATACHERALAIATASGDLAMQGNALGNIASVWSDRGDLRRALEFHTRSLQLKLQTGAPSTSVSTTLYNLSAVHDRQGDYETGLDYGLRALALLSEDVNPGDMAATLTGVGLSLRRLGRFDESREHLTRALTLARRQNEQRWVAVALHDLAELDAVLDRPAAALAQFEESLAVSRSIGDRPGIMHNLNSIGELLIRQRRLDEADVRVREALDQAVYVGSLDATWEAQTQLGAIHGARGEATAAEHRYREAIATIEELRGSVAGGTEQAQQTFAGRTDPYRALAHLMVGTGRAAEALAAAEQARARTLMDVLTAPAAQQAPLTAPEMEDTRTKRRAVVATHAALTAARAAGTSDAALAVAEQQVRAARRDQDALQRDLDRRYPQRRLRRADVPPLTPADLAALVPDAAHAVLEFVAGEESSDVIVVRRHATGAVTITARTIAITGVELGRRVTAFRAALAARDLSTRQAARALHETLLGPVHQELAGASVWTVVPDGPLWELPVSALVGRSGRYVVEDAAVSYAPSLSAIVSLRGRQTSATRPRPEALAAIFGAAGSRTPTAVRDGDELPLPPLKEAERQANALGELYGTGARVFIGAEAGKHRVGTEGGRARILHIAAHAVLDDRNPMQSFLRLARRDGEGVEAGVLDAAELGGLRLSADLVVLAACETGRGLVRAGEGLVGLSWAALAAGATSTVVSQWQVDAVSTTEFMTAFHRRVKESVRRTGHVSGRASALRGAALRLLRGGTYAHPFYWAPFVLVGDGS